MLQPVSNLCDEREEPPGVGEMMCLSWREIGIIKRFVELFGNHMTVFSVCDELFDEYRIVVTTGIFPCPVNQVLQHRHYDVKDWKGWRVRV